MTRDRFLRDCLRSQSKEIFAVSLDHADESDGGEIQWGFTDPTKYKGNLTYYPMVKEGQYRSYPHCNLTSGDGSLRSMRLPSGTLNWQATGLEDPSGIATIGDLTVVTRSRSPEDGGRWWWGRLEPPRSGGGHVLYCQSRGWR